MATVAKPSISAPPELPLLVPLWFGLAVAVAAGGAALPPWLWMWLLAATIYAACNALMFASFLPRHREVSAYRALGFLLAWPGLDAQAFLSPRRPASPPRWPQWLWAAVMFALGVVLFWYAAAALATTHWLLAGWSGMIGLVLMLHFGLFHALALLWQAAGVDARPIMNAPLRASSLADFWGRRWNLAFRDVAHGLVFRPLLRRCGARWATLAVFACSGIVHDLVISLPAGAGFGLPTAYFLLQGTGLLAERSRWGRRVGLGRGVTGRLFAAVVIAGPLYWLFHPPFVQQVALPMLRALGGL